MTSSNPFSWRQGLVVFCFSLGLILYELCLTRVLSVVFFYHTAFLAVSLAMLGLGAGGVWVYLFPRSFEDKIEKWLFAVGGMVSILPIICGVLRFDIGLMIKNVWSVSLVLVFFLVTFVAWLPFVCGGVVLAYWFRKYQEQSAKLYAYDLIGAAFGSLLLVPLMEYFGGLAALMCCGWVLLLSVVMAARWSGRTSLLKGSITLVAVLTLLIGVQSQYKMLSIQVDSTKKGQKEPLFKKWNAFSRVVLLQNQGWDRGISLVRERHWKGKIPSQLDALIDINAFAPIIKFDGDLHKIRYLKELVSNVGYHLLPKGQRVGILGPGGGKDILGALLFSPKKVVGMELNPILVNDLLKNGLYEYTGKLVDHPKVKVLLGEGRATLESLQETFDVIVANSVVTWAAHSSGAMHLAEHNLYTQEACELYFERLSKKGILSVSLWDVTHHAIPLRWLTTCDAAAKKHGIQSLKDHVMILGNSWNKNTWFSTILISKSPWTKKQKKKAEELSTRYFFDIHYIPGHDMNRKAFNRFFKDEKSFVAGFRYNIAPATDDWPFFLYTVRWDEVLTFWKRKSWEEDAALINLVLSFAVVTFLLLLMILVPLLWAKYSRRSSVSLSFLEILYFLGIGLGFMCLEIPLIQRLTLFLGHPTYALTVGLAGILFWSGVGSYIADKWNQSENSSFILLMMLGLLCLFLLGLYFGLNMVLLSLGHLSTFGRIIFTLFLLAPLGLCMGMPLPLGMVLLKGRSQAVPWAWGINGASSVVASVGVLWVAASWGFSVTFFMAFAFYFLAFLAVWGGRVLAESD